MCTDCVLACAVQRLRALNLLIQFVVWSFVVAYVVGVAILPGTPRYRRTRHAERRQGKALYLVRPPNHAPTTKQQPHRRADAAPTRRPRTGMVVRTQWCHAGVSTYDGRLFAHLLHRAEKPALRHGPCRRYLFDASSSPYTRMHTHMRTLTGTRMRRTKSPTKAGGPSRAGTRARTHHPPETRPPSLSASCEPPPPPSAMRPADLWPFIVADVGHDKLFCEEFCAGVDVLGEMHSRTLVGQEVRGNNEYSQTHVGYSQYRDGSTHGTRSTHIAPRLAAAAALRGGSGGTTGRTAATAA